MPTGAAGRIRGLRIRAGRSKPEMAERLGLNAAWYEDLEQQDDALAETLTLFQAMELAALLGVRLDALFADGGASGTHVPLLELPERIREHMTREGLSIEALEAQVGGPLGELMDSPLQAAATLPLGSFQSLASALRIDWRSLIPESE